MAAGSRFSVVTGRLIVLPIGPNQDGRLAMLDGKG